MAIETVGYVPEATVSLQGSACMYSTSSPSTHRQEASVWLVWRGTLARKRAASTWCSYYTAACAGTLIAVCESHCGANGSKRGRGGLISRHGRCRQIGILPWYCRMTLRAWRRGGCVPDLEMRMGLNDAIAFLGLVVVSKQANKRAAAC